MEEMGLMMVKEFQDVMFGKFGLSAIYLGIDNTARVTPC